MKATLVLLGLCLVVALSAGDNQAENEIDNLETRDLESHDENKEIHVAKRLFGGKVWGIRIPKANSFSKSMLSKRGKFMGYRVRMGPQIQKARNVHRKRRKYKRHATYRASRGRAVGPRRRRGNAAYRRRQRHIAQSRARSQSKMRRYLKSQGKVRKYVCGKHWNGRIGRWTQSCKYKWVKSGGRVTRRPSRRTVRRRPVRRRPVRRRPVRRRPVRRRPVRRRPVRKRPVRRRPVRRCKNVWNKWRRRYYRTCSWVYPKRRARRSTRRAVKTKNGRIRKRFCRKYYNRRTRRSEKRCFYAWVYPKNGGKRSTRRSYVRPVKRRKKLVCGRYYNRRRRRWYRRCTWRYVAAKRRRRRKWVCKIAKNPKTRRWYRKCYWAMV